MYKKMKTKITTEYVSFGHPDKIADQISDSIVDAFMEIDCKARVAVETMVKDNIIVLGGEISSTQTIQYDAVVRDVVKDIGYILGSGFHWSEVKIINLIGKQSLEIGKGVGDGETIGSGDQGIMFGYSTNTTPTRMPLGIYLSKLFLSFINDPGMINLGPDAKSQVTISFENGVTKIDTILISTMHPKSVDLLELTTRLNNWLPSSKIETKLNEVGLTFNENTNVLINPIGEWNIGGPISDCGVTGRKIVVDQYGPYSPVGGGCMSGKDYSKTDRTGNYLARYIANCLVESKWFETCSVQLAYIIGGSEPISVKIHGIDSLGDDIVLDQDVIEKLYTIFPMKLMDTIDTFNLEHICYQELAKYGHFGKDVGEEFGLPWELVPDDLIKKIDEIRKAL